MKRFTAAALVSAFLAAPAAYADPEQPSGDASKPDIRASIANVRFELETQPPRFGAARPTHKNNAAQKATVAFVFGLAGLLGGAFVGAMAQPDCHCHDQGLDGAIIGMPIGAAIGAIVGWRLAR